MDHRAQIVSAQFELQTRLYKNVLEGLENNGMKRISQATNHLGWLAGHLVSTRYMLCNVLGEEAQEPHPALFQNGKGIDSEADYPSLTSCLKDWDAITPRLMNRLKSLSAQQLEAKAPFQIPMGERIDHFVGFIAHHEAYHIGQMGILRKYFGKEAMKYS